MRNYGFEIGLGSDVILRVRDKDGNFIARIEFSAGSAVYLAYQKADGKTGDRCSVEEVIDYVLPEATTEDLKSFCGFIFLLGRKMI